MQIPSPTLPTSVSHPASAAYIAAIAGTNATPKELKAADTHALVKSKTDNISTQAGNEITASAVAIYGGTAAEAQSVADSLGHQAFAQVGFETAIQNFLRYKRGMAPVSVVPADKVLSVTSGGVPISYDIIFGQLESLFQLYVPADAVVSITAAPAE